LGAVAEDRRGNDPLSLSRLGIDASFFLLIDGQLVWKEEKANDTHTHREKRENIRHSRPMLPG
jgi:hypothetical protein